MTNEEREAIKTLKGGSYVVFNRYDFLRCKKEIEATVSWIVATACENGNVDVDVMGLLCDGSSKISEELFDLFTKRL